MVENFNASDIGHYVEELKTNIAHINQLEPVMNILSKVGDRSIRMRLFDDAGTEVANMLCKVKDGKVLRLETHLTENADIEVTLDIKALQSIIEKPTKDRFLRQYFRRRIKIKGVSIGDFIG
jgi:hypothetical protein